MSEANGNPTGGATGTGEGTTNQQPAGGQPNPQPNPNPNPAPAGAVQAVSYENTGDVGLDMALSFVGKLGIGPGSPEMQAAETGNFNLLKAKLASLGAAAQGWEQYVALGEASWKTASDAQKAKVEATDKIVHEAAGGAENWKAVQAWIAEKGEPSERAAINAALDAGGIAAKAVAMYLTHVHSLTAGGSAHAEVFAGGQQQRNGGDASSQALSPRAYVAEVQKLRVKLGGRMDGSSEYASLQKRAAAWRP